MLAAHVLLDVGSEVVAGNLDGVIGHDATQRDNGYLGGAATYVDNHVAFGSLNVDAYAECSSHRLEDKIDVATVGVFGRVAHGTQVDLG